MNPSLAITTILALFLAVGCSSPTTTADTGTDVGPTDGSADHGAIDASDVTDARGDVATDVSDVQSDITTDVPIDVAPDVTQDVAPDVAADVAPDVVADTGADAAGTCDPLTGCTPYWCGCGRCDPSTITCIGSPMTCPLGCPSSCPELAEAVCACTGGACGAPGFPTDAGVGDAGTSDGGSVTGDASVDAGGGVGTACSGVADCDPGLLCCYPCGIPGCHDVCTVPTGGHCPLIP